MLQTAIDNGIPTDQVRSLRKVVSSSTSNFRTSFPSGPPTKVLTFKINLVADAKPVRVLFRNYSLDQRSFLSTFVLKFVACEMAKPDPSSTWASEPLLVPKPGPDKLKFTVSFRPVNSFTVPHQIPMPIIDQELFKLAVSRHFSTIDLSH